jgi:hypothetical protein
MWDDNVRHNERASPVTGSLFLVAQSRSRSQPEGCQLTTPMVPSCRLSCCPAVLVDQAIEDVYPLDLIGTGQRPPSKC